MENSNIISNNLKSLCVKFGYSQVFIAEYLNITPAAVNQYENDARTIPTSVIGKLALLYNIEEYDLYEENTEKQSLNIAFAFRANELLPTDMQTISKFKKIIGNYINMSIALENEQAWFYSWETSKWFQTKNSFNLSEAIRIKSVLQKINILTVFLPLAPDFSGMAVRIGEYEKTKRFLLINCNHTLGRQHFTVCHELYHLYCQTNFQSSKNNAGAFNKNGDPEEYKADLFGSYLLLPTAGISQMIPELEFSKNKITLKTILAIEHYYSCSRSALLSRLKHIGLIDNELMESLLVNKIKNAVLYGYNKDLYLPGNSGVVIGDYGTIAHDLFEKGIVSESAYFSLLEDLGFDLSELDNKTDNE